MDDRYQSIFNIFAELIYKAHQHEAYKIFKAIKKQKMDSFKEFFQNEMKKDGIKLLFSKVSAEDYDQIDIQYILKIWFYTYFSKNDNNDMNDENLFTFIEAIANIIDQQIILINDKSVLYESEDNDYDRKLLLYYKKEDKKYYIKENVDKNLIRKYKSTECKKILCVKCDKLWIEKDKEIVFYEGCQHYSCKKCASISLDQFCFLCQNILEDVDDINLCSNCKITYERSLLIKCKDCKKRFCRFCYLSSKSRLKCIYCQK